MTGRGLLLDTHALMWFVEDSARLTEVAASAIESAGTDVWVSVASLWEMAIKVSIGRLALAWPLSDYAQGMLARNGFRLLPIELEHVVAVQVLPLHHRDPFDRMLAAQCISEGLTLVSADPFAEAYGVPRLW